MSRPRSISSPGAVGWSMSAAMTAQLVTDALVMRSGAAASPKRVRVTRNLLARTRSDHTREGDLPAGTGLALGRPSPKRCWRPVDCPGNAPPDVIAPYHAGRLRSLRGLKFHLANHPAAFILSVGGSGIQVGQRGARLSERQPAATSATFFVIETVQGCQPAHKQKGGGG